LTVSSCYLAEPIDFARHTGTQAKVQEVVGQLSDLGLTVFRPATAWASGPRTDHTSQHVLRLNKEALLSSSIVVAILPNDIRTIGVPMELAWATESGIPAVVITETYNSAMLNGNPLIVTVDRIDMLPWAINQARHRADEWSDRDQRQAIQVFTEAEAAGKVGRTGRELRYRSPALGVDPMLQRAHASDVGFDLFTTEDTSIQPGGFEFIPCGVEIEFPDDVFGWVVARSSTMERWGLTISPGVIDSGYRGELGVPAYRVPGWPWNSDLTSSSPAYESQYRIPAGTRLAQLVLLHNTSRDFISTNVDELQAGDRGARGFGSTGLGAGLREDMA